MNVSQNYQQSRPKVVSPFGEIPTHAAGKYFEGFAAPFAKGVGKGRVRGMGEQVGGVLQNLIPQYQQLAGETAGMARSAYGGYQASVDQFMKQLPGFQGALNAAYQGPGGVAAGDVEAQNYASQAAKEAFSPTASSALYNQFANQALGQARTSEAARGITDTGAAGAAERQDILTPLARDFAANRSANEQAAISGLSGATSNRMANASGYAGTGAGLASMGPQMQQQLFQAMPQLIQSLVTSMGLPAQAAGSIIQMLTGAYQPLIQTADVTKPTVAQSSFGGGGSVGVCDMARKRDVKDDVPGLEVVDLLETLSFEYEPDIGLPTERQLGLNAQQVQAHIPEAIVEREIGLAIDYKMLIPVLVKAIQQLVIRVAELEVKDHG
jgi:hypothetical protein